MEPGSAESDWSWRDAADRRPQITRVSSFFGANGMKRIIWIVILGLSSAAGAQDVFRGKSATATLPPDLYNAAEPAPDLHKYLTPEGFDSCRYWHDHPDSTTLLYGWPDRFAPGQIGQTESYNGQPAPYVRCAVNPCPPNGYICWRNPAKPTTLNAQIQATLKAQGCEAEPNGDIYCQKDRMPHPGPPSRTLSSGLVKSVCRVIGTGISCNPGSSPQPGPSTDTFNGKDHWSQKGVGEPDYIRESLRSVPPPPPPVHRPKYAPLDWKRVPICRDTTPSPGKGRILNYFWIVDPHWWGMDWISDSRYITIGGHGAPGAPGVGGCTDRASLVALDRIVDHLHGLLILPANARKRVRLAACDSADANPNDPSSVPTAQQLADLYRERYGTPITVEGYSGAIQYHKDNRLQDFPCRVFTSRTPLPEK